MHFEICSLQTYWFWRCKCSLTPLSGVDFVSLLLAVFPCRSGSHIYGVCEWRLLPCSAPQQCEQVNHQPPTGLRYPETPLTASIWPFLSLLNPPGITRSPQPEHKQVLSPSPATFCLYRQSKTPLLNGVIYSCLIRWLKDSLSLFLFLFFHLHSSCFTILDALWTRPSSIFVFILIKKNK